MRGGRSTPFLDRFEKRWRIENDQRVRLLAELLANRRVTFHQSKKVFVPRHQVTIVVSDGEINVRLVLSGSRVVKDMGDPAYEDGFKQEPLEKIVDHSFCKFRKVL